METTQIVRLTERHLGGIIDRRLVTQFHVTSILADSPTIKAGIEALLRAIGQGMDWDFGEFWKLDEQKGVLVFNSHWSRPGTEASELLEFNKTHTFEKGSGTPGLAWAMKQPLWTEEITTDACFYRKTLAATHGLHTSIAFPVTQGGKVLGIILFFTRLKKQYDEELKRILGDIGSQIGHFIHRKEQEIELRRLNEELSAFTRTVSHDLKDPLSTIIGHLSISLEGSNSPETRHHIERALERCSGMATFINDLLEFCYVENEARDIERIDLNQIVEEVLLLLEAKINEAGATINILSSLPKVHMEKACAVLLFQNLISNAIKYRSPNRRPEITLDAKSDDVSWQIVLKDNGVGIPEEDRSKIFDPFTRGTYAHQLDAHGHGLGLATCRRIVDRYKGTIWCESQVEEGTTFFFQVPDYR